MPEDVDQLKQAFGNAIVRKDHEALDILLPPWIGVGAALEKVDAYVAELAEELDLGEGGWPVAFEPVTGVLTYQNLREPSDFAPGIDIPLQVTEANYVGWHAITGIAAEDSDIDAWFTAWFAVVRLADGLHVGSLEIVDPD